MLAQQGPYSEKGSPSKNVVLDKYLQMTVETKEKKPTVCCPYTLIIMGVRKMKAEVPKSLLPGTSW